MQILSPSSVLLRTQSDERLVVLARAGHERAFEAIVERYRGALLRGRPPLPARGARRGRAPAGLHLRVERDPARGRGARPARLAVPDRPQHGAEPAPRLGLRLRGARGLAARGSFGAGRGARAAARCMRRDAHARSPRCPNASARRCCGSPSRGARRTRSRASSAISEGAVRQLVHRGAADAARRRATAVDAAAAGRRGRRRALRLRRRRGRHDRRPDAELVTSGGVPYLAGGRDRLSRPRPRCGAAITRRRLADASGGAR